MRETSRGVEIDYGRHEVVIENISLSQINSDDFAIM